MKFDDKAKELFGAKELFDAAKKLRLYCCQIECKNCIFCVEGFGCVIEDTPEDWQIEGAERELNI